MTYNREELLALAERVEALKEPCFATECEIEHAVSPHWTGEGLPNLYTASLDAAMSLRPEGGDAEIQTRGEFAHASLQDAEGMLVESINAATPAHALTAAALKALAETAR